MAQKKLQTDVEKFQTNYDWMKLELEEEANNNEEHNKSIVTATSESSDSQVNFDEIRNQV